MTRLQLERNQVWIYLAAILVGTTAGALAPARSAIAEPALWPLLIILLYATFVQIPMLHLRRSLANSRFISAALLGNFAILPLIIWGLVQWLPDDPVLRLGVLMVLLVPCTDWFITFTHLGKGDTSLAIAVTPLNLILQLALLPFYLWLMTDNKITSAIPLASLVPAAMVILLPLGAAIISERWMEGSTTGNRLREALGWTPVPLLALVILLIAATQVSAVGDAIALAPRVLPVFVAFLVIAALLGKLLARAWHLPVSQGRALVFTFGTRNSFVVLPVALALPAGWELAAAVIVMQSLIELAGMLLYLKWIPEKLFRDRA